MHQLCCAMWDPPCWPKYSENSMSAVCEDFLQLNIACHPASACTLSIDAATEQPLCQEVELLPPVSHYLGTVLIC